MEEINKKFVNSFLSVDGWRYNLSKPTCYENGWCVSSDAYSLLLFHDPEFHKENDAFFYTEGGDGVNALSIIEPYKDIYEGKVNPIAVFDLKNTEVVFEQIKMIPEYSEKYKTCDECDGEGEIECDCCGHTRDCDECDGDGQIVCGEEETGDYRYPDDEAFDVGGVYISFGKMKETIDRLNILGQSKLELYSHDNQTRLFGRVPNTNMFVLVMGLMKENQKTHRIDLDVI
jgi:hypothetical protein